MDDALPYFSEIRMPLPVQKICFRCPLPFPTGCCYSQHNSLPASPCENTVQESIPEIFSAFPGVEISLCLSPLLHINKKARLLRMRNPLTYSHPLRSGLSRRIICKYCRTSQRLGWIGHLYYKEDCSPCRTQTGTEKVASPCMRPLVWWRLVFSGVLERLQAIRKR